MADFALRVLRDGSTPGIGAPLLLVKDSVAAIGGRAVFLQLLQNLQRAAVAGRAQAEGIVAVALEQPPEVFVAILQGHPGTSVEDTTRNAWSKVIDCFTDPLGWASSLPHPPPTGEARHPGASSELEQLVPCGITRLNDLCGAIVRCGEGAGRAAAQSPHSLSPSPSPCFYVALDSVSRLLRRHTLPAVAAFLQRLLWHEKVSGLLVAMHEDLHASAEVAAVEYLAAATLTLHPPPPAFAPTLPAGGIGRAAASGRPQALLHEGMHGQVHLRQKRRNGKTRQLVEGYTLQLEGSVRFSAIKDVLAEAETRPPVKKSTVEVPFNLSLSESERRDRERVVLPYEHQGDGREVRIYDGRQAGALERLSARGDRRKEEAPDAPSISSLGGEIHYLRDSDDEMPDSDEDPDDDLDI